VNRGVFCGSPVNLASGTRLGPYEIVAPLGAGGMGEVYRARDTRLGRSVAIKVLPAEFAADARLRLRLEREAQAISALNHPHICALYDIGPDYLVMEHCEGKTLARRLADGPLPFDQAIEYAMQIADALDKAHRQGIIHRDLKPSNIMITKSGARILDFGLAKQSFAATADESTLEQATEHGVIVGTIQYMAPEVLSGKDADARSDIFALGCVMYEMVTGRPAFSGTSKATVIAAILEHEPTPIGTLRPDVPATLARLINACLAKDPDNRVQSAHDVLLELRWSTESTATSKSRKSKRWLAPIGIVAIVALTIAATAIVLKRGSDGHSPGVRRLAVTLPQTAPIARRLVIGGLFAISPDGTRLVYAADDALYTRRLDNVAIERIAGTEGASAPFFSPDGSWIAFSVPGSLKKVPITGGAPLTICEVARLRGAAWLGNNTIVFGQAVGPLMRVPASGGIPRPIVKPTNEMQSIRWPMPLAGTRELLVTITDGTGDPDRNEIAVVELADGRLRTVLRGGTYAQYASTGHLVFSRASTIHRVRFDTRTKEITGEPQPIIDDAAHSSAMGKAFVVVSGKTIYYLPRDPAAKEREIVWVDRRGQITPAVEKRQGYAPLGFVGPQLSPDGSQIVTGICSVMDRSAAEAGRECDIWRYDIARATWNRLTSDGNNGNAIWSPDGKRIAYWSNRTGPFNVFVISSDGSGEPHQLTYDKVGWPCPTSWSPDGNLIAVFAQLSTNNYVRFVPLDASRRAISYLTTPFSGLMPAFSPDGHWLAYSSDRSGESEIYIRAVDGEGPPLKVSEGGGAAPRWRPDGKELFYSGPKAMMAVDVTAAPPLSFGKPRILFVRPSSMDSSAPFDVSRDGQRFLMIRSPQLEPETRINVVEGLLE